MLKEIRLAGGKKAYVDDDIFSIVGGLGWQTSTHGKNWYAYRQLWFRNAPKKVYLHHVVMGVPLNRKTVDHIDGDGLNCTRGNLRIVTHRANCQNRRDRREGMTSSRYLGVCWYAKKGKWRAQIQIGGRTKWLGDFSQEHDAASAYQEALRCLPR